MSGGRIPVEIHKGEDGSLDISCLDTLTCLGNPNGEGRLLWQMPFQQAVDLARWWRTESNDVKNGQKEVRNKKVGSVLVSMFAPRLIHVRGLNKFGNIEIVGYSLPSAVVEYLASWIF
jgi:hypothetical protein